MLALISTNGYELKYQAVRFVNTGFLINLCNSKCTITITYIFVETCQIST